MIHDKIQDMCIICLSYCEVEEMCAENHKYCIECLNYHYHSMIADGFVNNSCIKCKNPFNKSKLLAYLRVEIYKQITNVFEAFAIVDKNLSLVKCPCCPNDSKGMFLIDKKDYIQFYTCENSQCGKLICLYCMTEVIGKNNINNHCKCRTYFKILLDFEKVIDYCIAICCPKCRKNSNSGDYLPPTCKDNNCTHISCKNCNMKYCYICGGHQEDVDKASTILGEPIARHNADWSVNSKRCPSFVMMFSELYPTWPKTEETAVDFFLKYKRNSFIKAVVQKYGLNNAKSAYQTYKSTRLALIPENVWDENYSNFKQYPKVDEKIFCIFNIK